MKLLLFTNYYTEFSIVSFLQYKITGNMKIVINKLNMDLSSATFSSENSLLKILQNKIQLCKIYITLYMILVFSSNYYTEFSIVSFLQKKISFKNK